jgi:hypothetical protein
MVRVVILLALLVVATAAYPAIAHRIDNRCRADDGVHLSSSCLAESYPNLLARRISAGVFDDPLARTSYIFSVLNSASLVSVDPWRAGAGVSWWMREMTSALENSQRGPETEKILRAKAASRTS